MAEGEELPPVVAVLEGDDASFLEMLDRDVAALRGAAAEIEALLASLDLGAGLTASLSGTDLSSFNSDQLAQGLGEQMAGVGSALAQDLGGELGSELAAAGVEAGQALTDGVTEGAAGLGALAADLGRELAAPMEGAGAEAGAALEQGVASALAGLRDTAQSAGTGAGAALTAGVQGALFSLPGMALTAGADLAAALTTGGAAGGDALAAGIGAAVAGSAGDVAQRAAEAIGASLETSLTQAGMSGGDALTAGLSYGASQAADQVAQDIAEALAASLETSMTEAGMTAGDALTAGMSTAAGQRAGEVAAEFGTALDLPATEAAAQAGTAAGQAYVAGFSAPVADMNARFAEWQAGQGGSSFTPHVSTQAFLDEMAQAEAAQQALAASMAADEEIIQNGIDHFLALSDAQLRQWMAEVESAAATSSSAFIDAYSAINEQLGASTELTMRQATAMEYLYTEARAEMDALQAEAIAFNESIKTLDFTPSSMTINAPVGGFSEEEMSAMVAGFDRTGAAAEKAAGGVKSFGGAGMMAQMAIFSLASFAPQLIGELEQVSGVGDHTAVSVQSIEEAMLGMSSTVTGTSGNLTQVTEALGAMSNGFGHAVIGLSDVNQALVQLQQTDPQLAAEQAAKVEAALEATGMSASDAKAAIAGYTEAVAASAIALAAEQHAVEDTVPGTQAFSDAVQQATIQMEQQTLQAQETAAAQQQVLAAVVPGTVAWTAAVQTNTTSLAYQAQQAAISADAQWEYATRLTAGTREYGYALDIAQSQLVASAASARVNAEALNGLLPEQAQLSTEALDTAQNFSEVRQATTEYTNAIDALFGRFGQASNAQAQFTIALGNLKGQIESGTSAVDLNTQAGAKNYEAFYNVAQAAEAAAAQIYQQTDDTQQADSVLQQMARSLDAAATKAHLTSDQVSTLNQELFGTKNLSDLHIDISADTSGATSALHNLLHTIDTSIGTITVQLMDNGNQYGSVKGPIASKRAGGGEVHAGETYLIGENGPELMQFGGSGFITPNDMVHPSVLSSGGSGGGAGPGGGPMFVFQFYPGVMLGDEMAFTNAIQQAMGNLGNLVPDQWASIQSTRGR